MTRFKISFYDYCIENNQMRWIDDWDYEKNKCTPKEVGYQSNKKYWFKCHRGLHESTSAYLCNISKYINRANQYCLCKKCISIGQYIIDTDGEDYLSTIWSDKNDLSPFDIARGSKIRIWLKCLNNMNHPDYDIMALNYTKTHRCPYCSGKRVCLENSIGNYSDKAIQLWSTKNEKTPFDYSYGSGETVFWKCENNIHDDYARQICDEITYEFRCPQCGRNNQSHPSGPSSPNWKGGVTPEGKRLRKSIEYAKWRSLVFEKDGYTCQCCGKIGGKLRAHHIHDFASNISERLLLSNGISLCNQCHDSNYPGGFHNLYGTHYKTEFELEEYINRKRKELGINEPFNIYDYMSSIEDDNLEIDSSQLDLWEEWEE